MKTIRKDIIHISFEIGLLIKGADGILEINGGFLTLYLNPNRMDRLITHLTRRELLEDPKDLIANVLINLSHSFSVSTQTFVAFYLISHGIIKCVLIALLWRKKLWAYPLTIVSLVLFIAYQVYRYSIHASVFLVLLTIFDIIMVILTFLEYKRMRALNFRRSDM